MITEQLTGQIPHERIGALSRRPSWRIIDVEGHLNHVRRLSQNARPWAVRVGSERTDRDTVAGAVTVRAGTPFEPNGDLGDSQRSA
jgi:hypothetical protein